jgi:Cu/Ag efflux protein CusF
VALGPLLTGCGGGAAPTASAPDTSEVTAATEGRKWQVPATIHQIDAAQGLVLATHDPISEVMPISMTMGFVAASPRVVAALRPGQRVVLGLEQRDLQLLIVSVSPA